MQESAYKIDAKGIRCGTSVYTGEKDCVAIDFGIGQINHKTIKAHNFDKTRLMSDLDYSVDASAKILAGFKSFKKNEPNWFCRYNAGSAPLWKIQETCETYTKLVARHM